MSAASAIWWSISTRCISRLGYNTLHDSVALRTDPLDDSSMVGIRVSWLTVCWISPTAPSKAGPTGYGLNSRPSTERSKKAHRPRCTQSSGNCSSPRSCMTRRNRAGMVMLSASLMVRLPNDETARFGRRFVQGDGGATPVVRTSLLAHSASRAWPQVWLLWPAPPPARSTWGELRWKGQESTAILPSLEP